MGNVPVPFIAAGIFLGLGLGGFVDGIVLHQLLQWHHMITALDNYPATTLDGLEMNTLWDGIFHTITWLFTVTGLAFLWNSTPVHRPRWGWVLFGGIIMGWGIFNLVDSVLDHYILGIHNVRDDVDDPFWWNLGFLASGFLLFAIGLALTRYGLVRQEPER